MLQEEHTQIVAKVASSGIEGEQEGEFRHGWESYRLLVWLPIVFSGFLFVLPYYFIQAIKSFVFLLYFFLSVTTLIISFTRVFNDELAITLRRFGLSFLVGLIVMTPFFIL